MVSEEPGCSHIIADKYAVSLVPAVIALCHSRHLAEAKNLLRRTVIWVCDRYEQGFGIAPVGSSAIDEVKVLLGYPFDFVRVTKNSSSFASTVLCDLAAILGDGKFYSDVVNDFKSCGIAFSYWQPQDTEGQFLITGEDVIQYPNIEYHDQLDTFETLDFAEHISKESRSFGLADSLGPIPYLGLCLLLRDRYFPSLWPKLLALV